MEPRGDPSVNGTGEGNDGAMLARENSGLPIPTRQDSSTSIKNELNNKDKENGSDIEDNGHKAGEKHKRTLSSDKLSSKFKPPFKKSDAPISKELSDRARSAPLVKKFALPPTETLINDYSAALLKHILIHGRMYVSQNYICFESKIFGIKTMEVIPFKDITKLSKKSKKLKFAHGIEVATSLQIYYFASFVSRERAYETLTKIWREHVPRTGEEDDEDDDDDDDGTQDYESDDSSLKKKGKKIGKDNVDGLKLGRSVECQPDVTDEKEKGLRRFSSPLLSRVLPNSSRNNSTTNLAISATIDQDQETSSPANSNSNTNTNTNNNTSTSSPSTPTAPVNIPFANIAASAETPVPSPHESEDEAEGDYDEGDGFLASEANFQPVLTTTFPVSVKTFFRIFFSDESTFSKTYHDSRSDKDLVVKKWSNSPQFGLIRDVIFLSPVKVPLGPSHTRLHETQRYHLTKNRLLIDTISMMLDIPYGDSFRVEGKWDVTGQTPDSCKLVVNIGVHFMKKTWFKGKIETQTIKETKESFQQWAALAPSEITKYKASLSASGLPLANTSQISLSSSTSSINSNTSTTSLNSKPLPPAPATSSPSPSPPSSDPSVSLEPADSLEGSSWKNKKGGEGGKFASALSFLPSTSSLTNSLSGQSIASTIWFLVFGFIFLHMYMRIAHLEGQVATLENILQPLLTKELAKKDL